MRWHCKYSTNYSIAHEVNNLFLCFYCEPPCSWGGAITCVSAEEFQPAHFSRRRNQTKLWTNSWTPKRRAKEKREVEQTARLLVPPLFPDHTLAGVLSVNLSKLNCSMRLAGFDLSLRVRVRAQDWPANLTGQTTLCTMSCTMPTFALY